MTVPSRATGRPPVFSPGPGSDLAAMRVAYGGDADLTEESLAGGWVPLVRSWLDHAVEAGAPEPNAMVLATVDSDGHPASRTVLCKHIDDAGVVFYTNYDSAKGHDLALHPYASVTFPWIAVQRQVTVRGPVVRVGADETLDYWRTRPRGSQLGAHASAQSRPIAGRVELEQQLADVTARFDGFDVPVPDGWGGFRIEPVTVEFWQGRNNRLHNRIRVDLQGDAVKLSRLQP